jgi:dipeptidyl aminopeptidase/acylaminoacyl peptidase
MRPENDDRQIRDILKRAAPPLPPEVREQAMAAVARTRPRGHRRLVTAIAVIVVLALLAAAVYATVRYLLIEGTLQFSSSKATPPGFEEHHRTDRYSEDLGWTTGAPPVTHLDVSPNGDDILYVDLGEDGWAPAESIWRAKADGSNPVNLTEKAGLSGANCAPTWSPDGRMIAFHHCDLVEGEPPCETGFHIWVMAADGGDARRVTPDGSPPTRVHDWSPDGSRLLCHMGAPDEEQTVTMDLWGRAIEVLPNVGGEAVWSPDGTMIASTLWEKRELDGRPGIRRALVVTRADGTGPRALAEQFVSDGDAEAHVDIQRPLWRGFVPDAARDLIDWKTDVQTHVGPRGHVWSPGSDKIAFLAAMPFDPDGLNYRLQVEVYICDLATRELTRITYDDEFQHTLVWR